MKQTHAYVLDLTMIDGDGDFRVHDVGLLYLLMIVLKRLTPFWKRRSIVMVWMNW